MADAADLTDIAGVRQFMQKRTSDTTQDPDLEVLITQASQAIQRFCNREFAPPSDAVTRSFEFQPTGNGLERIDVTPYELRAVSSLTLDADLGEGVVLSPVQIRLWPYPARDGTFFGVRLTNLPSPKPPSTLAASPALPFGTRRIDIEGDWGMAAVPAEVKHYANLAVESWVHLHRDPGLGAGNVDFKDMPPVRAEDLPAAVRWGLSSRWVRPTPEA